MVFDVFWNLFRKSLGNNVYTILKSSRFGRPYTYFSLPTFSDIFNRYKNTGISFKGKKILEVGGGNQFFTAFFFLKSGVRSVLFADPVFTSNTSPVYESQKVEFLAHFKNLTFPEPEPIHTYVSLESIPVSENGACDFICSHFVLEHFRDLDSFFKQTKRLLSANGTCFNVVDLSDHVYQLFNSRKATRWIYQTRLLYHLRYSDRFYNMVTDRRIWVNRLLIPSYRKLARKYDLEISDIEPLYCPETKIHPDLLKRESIDNEKELYVSHFSFRLSKKQQGSHGG